MLNLKRIKTLKVPVDCDNQLYQKVLSEVNERVTSHVFMLVSSPIAMLTNPVMFAVVATVGHSSNKA